MSPSEGSSWITRDVRIMDLQSGLLAVKQTVKLSEGLWMAIDLISVFSRESTLFLAISLHMWASRALL